ncbi:MAG: glycosyltransferase family 39 protein [Elusimicrobia bacterium]|nr:glycosyltransferase family 39 protein [Elusimicrobiota bacterium]
MGLRLIIPLYLIASGRPDATHDGFQTACYVETPFLTNLVLWMLGVFNRLFSTTIQGTATAKMIIQGAFDSAGCLLVFGMLRTRFSRDVALKGAFLYAVWLPSIFYASQILGEAYTPVLMLTFGYAIMQGLSRERWQPWYGLAGIVGALVAFTRFDNIAILPFFALFVLWAYRKTRWQAAARVGVLLGAFGLSCVLVKGAITLSAGRAGFTHSLNVSSPGEYRPSLPVALYNALGEYPGTYKGLRIFRDDAAFEHMKAQSARYASSGDRIHRWLCRLWPGNPFLMTYVREVVVGKPILYADWLFRRFVAYLPANPCIASVITFVSGSRGNAYMNQYGYRFSQVYQGLKYVDYALFAVFALGAWLCRRDNAMLSLLAIYLGVLAGHVFTQVGEVFHRMEAEEVFIDPRYLLGMVAIWPVFLPLGLDGIRNLIRGKTLEG